MFTVDTVLDNLKKFDIDEETIHRWEAELGLNIPKDEYGRPNYSPHHVNLFKNIRKHLALGRTMDEIRQIISLPPESASRAITPVRRQNATKAYATKPRRASMVPTQNGSSQVVQMLERLMAEKDELHQKLVDTEKLNSHLYNANNMFHRKVKELSGTVGSLKEQINENRNFKLLDEKAKLHGQLIESEKNLQLARRELDVVKQDLSRIREQAHENDLILQSKINQLENQLEDATRNFNPARFVGDWEEEARLIEVSYDNFGINIENHRERVFRISEVPERTFGNTAVISTQYEYESNALWKRNETLMVTYLEEGRLEGELTMEYIIDGVPVAKAIYRITCRHA